MDWNKGNEIDAFEMSADVTLGDFAATCRLKIVRGNPGDIMTLSTSNVNRPGLLLAGLDDYFGRKRIQVIGNAESYYLSQMTSEHQIQVIGNLLSKQPPCIVIARGIEPPTAFLEEAKHFNVPILTTDKPTTQIIDALTYYLSVLLAEYRTIHGTLIEVSGLGVLITGDSGMGKSETALELIHRGHKLVADDVTIVKKIQASILIGTAPEKTRFYMEVRGIGIIDVRELYGVGSVLYENSIDLVLRLEHHSDKTELERIQPADKFENILGVDVPKFCVPVMPGRNLALVTEVAARNFRLKAMGVDAERELLAKQFKKK